MSRDRQSEHDSDGEETLDLAELEGQLYAQVHYRCGDEDAGPSNAVENYTEPPETLRSVSSHSIVNNLSASRANGPKSKGQRYWYDHKGQEPITRPSKAHHKRFNQKPFSSASVGDDGDYGDDDNQTNNDPNVPPGKQPRPFTPYTPLFSESGNASPTNNDATGSTSNPVANVKRPNEKDKKRKIKSDDAAKCINPFNKIRERHKKQKEKYETKKARASKSRQVALAVQAITPAIFVDEPQESDDDDVVIIPTEPPPLICIDDSDEGEEVSTAKATAHEFTSPGTKSTKNHSSIQASSSRCPSPTSSIVSDDFIGHNDRRRIELDTFGGIPDEELVSITTFNGIVQINENGITSEIIESQVNNNANISHDIAPVFAEPANNRKRINPFSKKKSYVVNENSFAAVDVYESESSDMPDTVYAKGKQLRQRNPSSSDSDVNLIEESPPKSKRLHKRKSSGSNKGSDYNPNPTTSEEDDDDDDDDHHDVTVSQEVRNSLPFLVRGEALGKVKKLDKHKKKPKQRTTSTKGDKTSDEEFLSRLTSICNDGGANDDEEVDEDLETSRESVDAREIVQSVLQRRKKKLKVGDNSEDAAATNAEWVVKDQIGETDDVTFLNVKQSTFGETSNSTASPAKISKVPSTNETKDLPGNAHMAAPEDDNSGENSVTSNPSVVHPEIGWNEEMNCFYNQSWGGETFNSKQIQHNLPRSYGEWSIGTSDKYLTPGLGRSRPGNQSNARCTNCREKGHRAAQCPTPPLPPRCYMCGSAGHLEPRCPNTKCLLCGKNTKSFVYGCANCYRTADMVCHSCKARGHRAVDCPDKWRRYHSTTIPNTPLTHHEKPLPIKPKYCSVCSHKGHIAENCKNALRIFQYPLNSVFVRNYEESYRRTFDDEQDTNAMVYNTFYSPKKHYTFNYGDEVDPKGDTLYGRFAKAVRLDKIQKAIKDQYRKEAREIKRKRQLEGETSSAKVRKVDEPSTSNEQNSELIDAPAEDVNMSKESSGSAGTDKSSEASSENKCGEPMEVSATVQSIENPDEMVAKDDEIPTEVQAEVEADIEAKVQNEANPNIETGNELSTVEEQNKQAETGENNLNDKEDSAQDPLSNLDSAKTPDTYKTPNKVGTKKSSKAVNLKSEPRPSAVAKTPKQSAATDREQKLAEYKTLKREERRLERMRESLIASESPADDSEEEDDTDQSKDSNYDFSEYYEGKGKLTKKAQLSTSSRSDGNESDKLPEYIPLDAPGPSNLILSRNTTPTPPIVNETRCDATVFLTKEYTKFLLTTGGNHFLRSHSNKYDVIVRMEWRSFGNVLMVNGTPTNQEKFHSDLIDYCKSSEKKLKTRSEMGIPKFRQTLIKFIIETIQQLEKPMGNISDLFERMKRYERYDTKASTKQAERYRKEINMLLMGQIGLSDGRYHLTSLQQNLRELLDSSDEIINANFRKEINEHINYIFSPVDHGNYPDLVEQYKTLKRSRNLPILNLDRKLLGLPINTRVDRNAGTPHKNERTEQQEMVDGANDDDISDNSRRDDDSVTEKMADTAGKDGAGRTGELTASPKKSDVPSLKQDAKVNKLALKLKDAESDGDDLDKIDEKDIKNPTKPSTHWSNKCKNLVSEWSDVPQIKTNELVMLRLRKIKVKAEKNNISYNDYRALTKIFENIISSVDKPLAGEGGVPVFSTVDEIKKK